MRLDSNGGDLEMGKHHDNLFKTAVQLFAIVCLIALFSMVFHKAFADLSVLAQQHSGADFWAAVARHVLRNLAGG
jgi:hypothetical protein